MKLCSLIRNQSWEHITFEILHFDLPLVIVTSLMLLGFPYLAMYI